MEAVVRKRSLSLDYVDSSGSIREKVFGQLKKRFTSELFEISESLDAYTFSIRKDLPASPIMELRSRTYSLFNLNPDSFKEQELARMMDGANISQAIDIAMNSPKYDYFSWRRCRQQMHLNSVSDGFRGVLDFEACGLQFYISHSTFDAEISGELSLCTAALKKALGDMTYSDNVSLMIDT